MWSKSQILSNRNKEYKKTYQNGGVLYKIGDKYYAVREDLIDISIWNPKKLKWEQPYLNTVWCKIYKDFWQLAKPLEKYLSWETMIVVSLLVLRGVA